MNVFSPKWVDDVAYAWEPGENYTKGAVHVMGTSDRAVLDKFLKDAIRDTGENAFSIETSLCSVAKFVKGTRWNGYYTERMLEDASGTRYEGIINRLLICQ